MKIFYRKLLKIPYSKIKSRFEYPPITTLPSQIEKNFSLNARLNFYRQAQYFLQVNRMDGVYIEFGSHEANTFRMALNILGQYSKPNKINHFYAFDSFKGMPEPEGIDQQKNLESRNECND